MARQFVRVKIAAATEEVAINQDHILAFAPNGQKNGYFIWLTNPLQIPSSLATRISQLGGVTPLQQEMWDVTSTDLAAL